MSDYTWLADHGIIAILRGDYSRYILHMAEALYAGGVRVLEVTTNSPGAIAMIAQLRANYTDRMWIGAGTVLAVEHVEAVAEAGGQFIVSPDTYSPVIKAAIAHGLEAIPGAYTPSEIRTALRAGARFIKLFPAMPAGPDYLKQLRGPLPDVPFIATGGIGLDDVAPFVRAGATGFGVGSALIPKTFTGTHDEIQRVTATASAFCEALAHAQGRV